MSWKIIAGALAILGSFAGFWVLHEMCTGVAYTRGGTIIRSESPIGFWMLSAVNLAGVAALFFAAASAWRRGQREPDF